MSQNPLTETLYTLLPGCHQGSHGLTAKRVSRKSERAKCELGKWPLLVTKEYPS